MGTVVPNTIPRVFSYIPNTVGMVFGNASPKRTPKHHPHANVSKHWNPMFGTTVPKHTHPTHAPSKH